MKIACLLTPPDNQNLTLASQIGVEEVVASYPGPKGGELMPLREEVESHGMRLTTIERYLPLHSIVHQLPGYEERIEEIQILIEKMRYAGLTTLCYNWMPSEDWNRTDVSVRERGGALVTEFDATKTAYVPHGSSVVHGEVTPAEKLWETLETFLRAVVPVAEQYGINLAIHPDDPPLSRINGQEQIMTSPEALWRATELVPSERNGICFCQGTLASVGGVDLPAMIRNLGSRVKFIHFRDVVGEIPRFRESFHDNGKTDMAACWRAYEEAGLQDIPIRPDHVPSMQGDTNQCPGYEMQGRLFAIGYMKGLRDAIAG